MIGVMLNRVGTCHFYGCLAIALHVVLSACSLDTQGRLDPHAVVADAEQSETAEEDVSIPPTDDAPHDTSTGEDSPRDRHPDDASAPETTQLCQPDTKACEQEVAVVCASDGMSQSRTDCAGQNPALKCFEGTCVGCVPDCADECEGGDDSCQGACPDPCSGHAVACLWGGCTCNFGYSGDHCDQCAATHGGYPDCRVCGALGAPCCAFPKADTCVQGDCLNGTCSCPAEMARIGQSNICIDRFEASQVGDMAGSESGAQPWVNVTQAEAASACDRAGKRLCSLDEWHQACSGTGNNVFPYGSEYMAGACNINSNPECVHDGSGVQAAGAMSGCRNIDGDIYDMSGNVWEWVSDSNGANCNMVGGSVDSCDAPEEKTACASVGAMKCDDTWPAAGFRCCKALSLL